jgi:thiol-disulfide isomerase/thioredoxin
MSAMRDPEKTRKKRWRRALGLALALLVAGLGCAPRPVPPAPVPGPQPPIPAPPPPPPRSAVPASAAQLAHPFAALDINPRSSTHGDRLALAELYAERGVVLRFVASWCEICRAELPDLQELHASGEAKVVVVAADEYGGPDSMVIVAERSALTTPVLYVPEAEVARLARHYSYEILPATYVIDRAGTVRVFHQGALSKERLVAALEVLGP